MAVMTYNLLVFTLAQVPGSKHIFRFWYDEVRGRSQLDLRSNGGVFFGTKTLYLKHRKILVYLG